MDNDRPTHAKVIADMLAKTANEFGYKALPTRPKGEQTPFGANLRTWAVEEVGFLPSKVWHLSKVFRAKASAYPSLITALYLALIKLVFVLPFFILQALVWQLWRTVKNVCGVLRGTLSYLDKEKLFPKNK